MTEHNTGCEAEDCFWCAGRDLAPDFGDHATMALEIHPSQVVSIALLYTWLAMHMVVLGEEKQEVARRTAHAAVDQVFDTIKP